MCCDRKMFLFCFVLKPSRCGERLPRNCDGGTLSATLVDLTDLTTSLINNDNDIGDAFVLECQERFCCCIDLGRFVMLFLPSEGCTTFLWFRKVFHWQPFTNYHLLCIVLFIFDSSLLSSIIFPCFKLNNYS